MSSTALKPASKSLNREALHGYQRRAVEFITSAPRCALFVDMGLGKTVSTATALQDLSDRFEVHKVLIIAPLRVAKTTWPTELENWEHITLRYSVAIGSPAEREAAIKKKADIYIINRENVPWLVEKMGKKWPFDCVVIDESTSFKNPRSQRFKALKKILGQVERVILLTGTPAPNSLLDLWAQMYLIDQGETLGRTFTHYKERFFESDYMGFRWTIRDGMAERIHEKVKPLCLTLQAKDYLELPPVVYNRVAVAMNEKQRAQYSKLEREFLLSVEDDEITALNAAALSNKLLQLANGAAYNESGSYSVIHDEKLTALQEIADTNEGKPLLVAYNYRSDLERLRARFPNAQVLDKDPATIDKWNAGDYSMMLAHPASAGHGLNLQAGGSIVVWFGLNWSLELYQQFNARLNRQGQKNTVIIHHIIAEGTIDLDVIGALERKEATQSTLIDALKKIKEQP